MLFTFAIAALVGVAVGVVSGLLGIGGGTIMVPIFRLAFGMSPVASTATSLFTIIPTSISGVFGHVRGKTCVPKLGLALGVGGACTSWVGVWLAQVSPSWLVMAAAAVVIGYSSVTMLRKALKAPRRERALVSPAAMPAGREAPSSAKADAGERAFASGLTVSDLAKGAVIGAIAGVASGYVGLGGGFLMMPLMLSLFNMPMSKASGTSLIAVVILAAPATIMQCAIGNVDYLAGIAMACGSIPGALLGSRFITRVPERALRFAFAAFLGVAAVLLVVKEIS